MLNAASLVAILLSLAAIQGPPSPQAAPAQPLDPTSAIVDAFKQHPVVCFGDAHGDRQGQAFQLALIQDPRIGAVVQDVVVETGNSRYQPIVDRYVNGEEIPQDTLERIWLDTTQQQVASRAIPEAVVAVRRLNAMRPGNQRLRVLLGEPPIEWERLKTADDLRAWEEQPTSDRDWFGADLVRREVLAKNRRALLLYGAGHCFRKPQSQSIVTLLESEKIRTFSIWTNVAAEMSSMQADVANWKVPSLTLVRGTVVGRVGMAEYLGPKAGDVSPQWLVPIEQQFDAVLYLGPVASITLDRPTPWPCADPASDERLRRLALRNPGAADRARKTCK